MKTFQDKVALVTGASSGIGRATALAFAEQGARVALADLDEEGGEATLGQLRQAGGEGFFVRTDVSSVEDIKRLFGRIERDFGQLDCAFNNAGIEGSASPLAKMGDDNWHKTLAINLTSVFFCMREEVRLMGPRGRGCIVNCSSVAGVRGIEGMAAYVASKHGVIGLTKTAAIDEAKRGVRVNAVCPGVIDTSMIERFTHGDKDALTSLCESAPMRRMGRPEEIAGTVLWLCSDAGGFVTGASILADGGWTAR
jgi:NAD(P)-dependent dehydrogenase (short-subunit alcohol dehydrogenase family)